VTDGRIVAGRLVRLACARHLRDLEDGASRGLRFDAHEAQETIDFFPEILRLAEGQHAGQPFVLQLWEQFIVGSLFGWYGADGFRRYRVAYIEVGKGNGKSPLAAGIGLKGLVADGEIGAEIYSAATTRDQAKIVWCDAQKMKDASPALVNCVYETVNNLAVHDTHSFFRPVSADASKLDGFRPHMVIADEVHEHPSSLVIDKMRAGFKGRRQPLLIEITNSGFDRHSVCWQHHNYIVEILTGGVPNDSWFGYICGLDPCDACRKEGADQPTDDCADCDDWQDEAVWLKSNPNLDVSVSRKYLREQVQEAVAMPAKQNIVKRLNFCLWTEQSARTIPMDLWDAGNEPVNIAELLGRPCYAGLDLAKIKDLSALALIFPPALEGERWKVLMRFWVPEEDIRKRADKDRVPYDVWVRDGFISATPGNATDFKRVREEALTFCAQFGVQELAYDRQFANETTQYIADETSIKVVEFGQGFSSMAAPTFELLRLLQAGLLQHGGNPVLRWNAANMAAQQDPAGNLKPDKERSRERIDGIVALIMAIGRAMVAPAPDTGSWLITTIPLGGGGQ
jgi:phage terminase large subunit-like protein